MRVTNKIFMLGVMSLYNDYLVLELHKAKLRELQAEARRRPAEFKARNAESRTAIRLPVQWNVSVAESAASYPCERLVRGPVRTLTRGIDIDAPVPVAYRWLCQLRVAPYSYDWIDNRGRRSPRTLTPGAEGLARGQRFLISEITDFEPDCHITGRATAGAERLFGVAATTYQVVPRGSGSRLLVRLVLHEPQTWWQRLRFHLLGWADLIMMRKQLLTLKECAERTASESRTEDVVPV